MYHLDFLSIYAIKPLVFMKIDSIKKFFLHLMPLRHLEKARIMKFRFAVALKQCRPYCIVFCTIFKLTIDLKDAWLWAVLASSRDQNSLEC